jgi:hypothetical protein
MYICSICDKVSERSMVCCNKFMYPECERIDCHNPGTKSIYGLGYIASVCEEHYRQATQQDKDDAIRFRQAER